MAILTPNTVYTVNGVTVNEKIIPDGTRWKDATKAKNAGFAAGSLYKKQAKLSGGTGKVQFITIHNTNDLANVNDDGEQYTRATYNENMGSARVHFYVDDICAWQDLKAGTGMCSNDPNGSAEVSWHAGDGSTATGGNMTSLSMEIIMNDSSKEHDLIAKDNGARLAAWLLWKHKLTIDALVTHTYWVNKSVGKTFSDRDTQSCNPISGKKWCPAYIFASNNSATALKNWKAFKQLVKGYLDKLNGGSTTVTPTTTPIVTPTTSTPAVSVSNEKIAWDFLKGKGLNDFAIAGILGNLYAESGIRANNLQNTYEKKLGYTDESYTAAVDSGKYTKFSSDSAGYGLAQWTYSTRKANLLAYAKKVGKSIGDINMQLEFLWQEMNTASYKNMMNVLKNTKSVKEASDAFLKDFERPAHIDTASPKRAEYAQGFYDKYKETTNVSSLPYKVRVTGNPLNIRSEPSTAGGTKTVVGSIRDNGIYTIVEESAGPGATKWGKLKSKAGWISLDYTKKV